MLDRLFGTYHLPKDRRPEVYGIDEPVPSGWVGQMLGPFRRRRDRQPNSDPAIRPDPNGSPVPASVPGASVAGAPDGGVLPWVPPA